MGRGYSPTAALGKRKRDDPERRSARGRESASRDERRSSRRLGRAQSAMAIRNRNSCSVWWPPMFDSTLAIPDESPSK